MLKSVRGMGTRFRDKGDVDEAFGRAKKIVEAEYVVPHLSHLQMEPLVATARVENGRAEIWAPTQNPQTARSEVAKLLGIDEANVTVNVTLLGGGFGRKSKADFVLEAAYLAKTMGAPVRVQWSREDEFAWEPYGAAMAFELEAALDRALEFRPGDVAARERALDLVYQPRRGGAELAAAALREWAA